MLTQLNNKLVSGGEQLEQKEAEHIRAQREYQEKIKEQRSKAEKLRIEKEKREQDLMQANA